MDDQAQKKIAFIIAGGIVVVAIGGFLIFASGMLFPTDQSPTASNSSPDSQSDQDYAPSIDLTDGLLYASAVPDEYTFRGTVNSTSIIPNTTTRTGAASTRFIHEHVSDDEPEHVIVETSAARYETSADAETALQTLVTDHGYSLSETQTGSEDSVQYHYFSFESNDGYTVTVKVRQDANILHAVVIKGSSPAPDFGDDLITTQAIQVSNL